MALIGLGWCPGWSESSLGAHAILLVLSWGGSYIFGLHNPTFFYTVRFVSVRINKGFGIALNCTGNLSLYSPHAKYNVPENACEYLHTLTPKLNNISDQEKKCISKLIWRPSPLPAPQSPPDPTERPILNRPTRSSPCTYLMMTLLIHHTQLLAHLDKPLTCS